MKKNELFSIFIAIIIMSFASSFLYVITGNFSLVPEIIIFSVILVCVPIIGKKITAYTLDCNVEHEVWGVYFFGLKPKQHFKKEIPFGIILPIVLSIFTLGTFKLLTLLTYETRALKHRAAKRFGYYSYTEMTDWHNALIGATGVISLYLLVIVSYVVGFEYLTKLAIYYSLFSLIPISKLDGTQIFFGSRIIWVVLSFISFLMTMYALVL